MRARRTQKENKALIAAQVMAFLNSLDCRDEFLIKKIKRTKEFKEFVYKKEILEAIPKLPYFEDSLFPLLA